MEYDVEHPQHYCGIFGVYGDPEAALKTYYGLYSLQHRGQESAGMVVSDGNDIWVRRRMGLVGEVFESAAINNHMGHLAIGHVRYSTTGSSSPSNIQPIVVDCQFGTIAVAHNGNLVNAAQLRGEYESRGSIFQTTTDSEILLHQLADPRLQKEANPIGTALRELMGSYSFLILFKDKIVAARDPHGLRPLVIGKSGDAWYVASETCAFDLIDVAFVRDVPPGHMVTIDKDGMRMEPFVPKEEIKPSHCIFEHVYFARPDSFINGDSVHGVRKRLGARLAKETGVDADIVVPVPDSGMCAALGYSEASGIPLDMAIIRNHYIGRTFINPSQKHRKEGVNIKLNIVKEAVYGKRLIVVDDSIIRGTTTRGRISNLRKCGAKEVHMRISCPPTRHPCFYGIDFPDPKKLLATGRDLDQIRDFLGVDSIGYLSVEGLLGSMSNPPENYCAACFTGQYPVDIPCGIHKNCLERGFKCDG